MKTILKSYSYIFHPLFVSVYTSLYFFGTKSGFYNSKAILYFISQIFIVTVLIPIAVFYVLKLLKVLNTDMMVNNVKQRRLPLAIQSIYFYFIAFHTFKPIPDTELRYFFIGALISSLLALLASLIKHKISLHMIGITGMSSFIIALFYKHSNPNLLLICLLVMICGTVASSRLAMKAHTNSELFWGTVIGVIGQILALIIWL